MLSSCLDVVLKKNPIGNKNIVRQDFIGFLLHAQKALALRFQNNVKAWSFQKALQTFNYINDKLFFNKLEQRK